jgi:hypothetical protein
MAKAKAGQPRPDSEVGLTYFFLITMTEKGKQRTNADIASDRTSTNAEVQKLGGRCALYHSRGAAYDYVSVMTNLSTADAIRMAEFLERSGKRIVKLLPGVPVFK